MGQSSALRLPSVRAQWRLRSCIAISPRDKCVARRGRAASAHLPVTRREERVMRVKEEFTEAQRRFGLLSFYDKFEHIVILILTALIAVFIIFAVWNLALKIYLSIL